jgi:DNA repair exonuclease SbcCD ATPase subunit
MLIGQEAQVAAARLFVNNTNTQLQSRKDAIIDAQKKIDGALKALNIDNRSELPDNKQLEQNKVSDNKERDEINEKIGQTKTQLESHQASIENLKKIEMDLKDAKKDYNRWERLNNYFGGTRLRTLVQTYILRPLLNNANIYLEKITDRYKLTCDEKNDKLSILVLDRYNKNQVRSATILSGGERFMISLALSLALSSLNRPDMNVNILFIDEGFGTLDQHSLDSVMATLEKLQEIAGQSNRRVGVISHREELERITVKIHVKKHGEGRSKVEIATNP